ncbi:hypothetical protein HYDPIDRAFT_86264 [Hydnomerulius pinastri MD-312]|nr:hypothetical protein HYDPIDRAFT_86264 [Hydnomerulius pinastri MD-312]
MPGLILSPSAVRVVEHHTPESFLAVAYPTLLRHERSSNIILAHALKKVSTESALTGCQFVTHSEVELDVPSNAEAPEQLWLTLWSTSPKGASILEMVLACHQASGDDLPVFLWTSQPLASASSQWLASRIRALVERLDACVPPTRVFSVFGMTRLVKAFHGEWSNLTGFQVGPQPFYAAYFTYCTDETFIGSSFVLPAGDFIRRATHSDIDGVAQLCKEFADDSIYFPLDLDRARVEAKGLINKGQIWIYESAGAVAAISAVTRTSLNVSAITKVYTCPNFRRRGFAEHLVRYVTRRLIDCGKEVVLYVGHENSAQRVYDRVGFVGLCNKDKPAGVEDALELGYVGTNRGHW